MSAIAWEYCECGCHGCDARVGPVRFWHFMRLNDKYEPVGFDLVINRRQGSYPPDQTFATADEMNAFCERYAEEALAKQVAESQQALDALRARKGD